MAPERNALAEQTLVSSVARPDWDFFNFQADFPAPKPVRMASPFYDPHPKTAIPRSVKTPVYSGKKSGKPDMLISMSGLGGM